MPVAYASIYYAPRTHQSAREHTPVRETGTHTGESSGPQYCQDAPFYAVNQQHQVPPRSTSAKAVHTSECTRNRAREKLPTSKPSPGSNLEQRSTQTRSPMPSGSTFVTVATVNSMRAVSAAFLALIYAASASACSRQGVLTQHVKLCLLAK